MPSLAEQAQTIAALYQPPHIGRPSDIGSASTVQQFLEAVGEGNYLDTAAKLAGLSKVTVYEWLKRADTGEEPYATFANSFKRAEARAEAHLVSLQRKAAEAGPQYWAAAATQLERRHPDRWGKRSEDGQAPKVVVQIGAGAADVKVAILTPLSPQNINDLPCGNQGQVEILSPIRENYVNQSESAPTLMSAPGDSPALREVPAVESTGGTHPTPPAVVSAERVRGQRVRRQRARRKKA